jgi:hypothetical protein
MDRAGTGENGDRGVKNFGIGSDFTGCWNLLEVEDLQSKGLDPGLEESDVLL